MLVHSPHKFLRVGFGDSIPAHNNSLWAVYPSHRISPWASSPEDIETLVRVMEVHKRLLVGSRILTVKMHGELRAAIFVQPESPYSGKLRVFGERYKGDASFPIWERRWQDLEA